MSRKSVLQMKNPNAADPDLNRETGTAKHAKSAKTPFLSFAYFAAFAVQKFLHPDPQPAEQAKKQEAHCKVPKLENGKTKIFLVLALIAILGLFLSSCSTTSAPGVTLTIDPQSPEPKQVTSGVQLLVLMTVLSLAPAVLILATSFTRIVIVLSMLRSAIGTPTIPPNQVIIGLSLLLTFFIMAPIYKQVDETAIQPYLDEKIDQDTAWTLAQKPIREFMFKQTREKDIQLFIDLGHEAQPATLDDIATTSLFPAFVISELRTAFTMGFVIYIPFLVIDLVVSSILLSMGMMMLPPSLVSLPFKLLLFVMVDGWYLIVRSLVLSFTGS